MFEDATTRLGNFQRAINILPNGDSSVLFCERVKRSPAENDVKKVSGVARQQWKNSKNLALISQVTPRQVEISEFFPFSPLCFVAKTSWQ